MLTVSCLAVQTKSVDSSILTIMTILTIFMIFYNFEICVTFEIWRLVTYETLIKILTIEKTIFVT